MSIATTDTLNYLDRIEFLSRHQARKNSTASSTFKRPILVTVPPRDSQSGPQVAPLASTMALAMSGLVSVGGNPSPRYAFTLINRSRDSVDPVDILGARNPTFSAMRSLISSLFTSTRFEREPCERLLAAMPTFHLEGLMKNNGPRVLRDEGDRTPNSSTRVRSRFRCFLGPLAAQSESCPDRAPIPTRMTSFVYRRLETSTPNRLGWCIGLTRSEMLTCHREKVASQLHRPHRPSSVVDGIPRPISRPSAQRAS